MGSLLGVLNQLAAEFSFSTLSAPPITYIVDHHLGNVVNDSWEVDLDLIAGPLEEEAFDDELKIAAAKGISFQFSSGDGGDDGLGTPVGAPGVPSNSPHATAVGGTSILNNINGTGYETLGWGTSAAALDAARPRRPPPLFAGTSGAARPQEPYHQVSRR